ncbi:hypothetical protein M9H77_06424 [Catharanthus roseus]|uniref:Uncharacterized protein n=1 Tax=Catharanthus roseus TaxID=4058 RepID=A0ACC0BS84_CATRO|nr:hypothetical protein M9H77_06424 [Catharanthus roseus]
MPPPRNVSTASCRGSRGICMNGLRRSSKINHDDGNNPVNVKLNINKLDPPLPCLGTQKAKFFARRDPIILLDAQVEDVNHDDSAVLQTGGQTLVRTKNHPHNT